MSMLERYHVRVRNVNSNEIKLCITFVIMKTLAERLAWARSEKQLSQQELADRAGVAQSTIGSLESGARQTGRKIASIASVLGVDPLWLAEGKGQPVPSGPGGLRGAEFMPVDIFHADNPKVVLIPHVRLRLNAGITGFHVEGESGSDTHPLDRAWVSRERLSAERLIAIKVKGESMEPGLFDGDIVVINTADTKPVDGSVYAINYEGEAVIKRMSRDAGSWWLTSDNSDQRKYHRKSVRGNECIIVGRVVKKESTRI
jgi:phage repressor protein C with HTH and peptisase S24 domain